MIFRSLEELKDAAADKHACINGLIFLDKCDTLSDALTDCDLSHRVWAIRNGFEQFEIDCDWEEFEGNDWSYVLVKRPELSDLCDWDKLKGVDWACLLTNRSEFFAFRKI